MKYKHLRINAMLTILMLTMGLMSFEWASSCDKDAYEQCEGSVTHHYYCYYNNKDLTVKKMIIHGSFRSYLMPGIYEVMYCPTGQWFNCKTIACDWPDNSYCDCIFNN